MVALDEQHLQQRAALRVQFLVSLSTSSPACGRHGAGCGGTPVDLDRAQLARAVRLEFRVIAQVRDVLARRPAPPA